MPQQDFEKSSAQNPRSRGRCQAQERRKPAAVPTAAGVQKTETWLGPPKHNYRKCIDTREIPTLEAGICVVYHVLRRSTRGDNGVYLHRAAPRLWPWGTGGVYRVTAVRPVRYNEKRRGMVVGSEATSLSPCHMFSNKSSIWPPTHPLG